MRFPCARIDGAALRHNLEVVRKMAPHSRVLAVIKANGYGHGLVPVAQALAGADALGVARLEEGRALRAAAISAPVVLLEGVFNNAELLIAAHQQFELVVHSFEQIALLEQFKVAHRFPVWLKLDTGMNRLGVRIDEFEQAWGRLQQCKCIDTLRLMTHLASAEEQGGDSTARQIALFNEVTESRDVERSIGNSAGLIAWPEARVEWVRPGLMLYGISPIAGVEALQMNLWPAMTLTTQLIATRRVSAGEAVGYNGLWRAERDSTIGIAAIGYGDGYPRNMRTGTPVLVDGVEATTVGRVSMDMIAVDVTELAGAKVGSIVTLWGDDLPAERVAPYADTIPYELVCGISQRVAVLWN